MSVGKHGTCQPAPAFCASFVGFNSLVKGATIEKDAMVLHLARVGPGVTIPSGRVVLSGRNVRSNAEVMDKTVAITDANREFMKGVVEVNVEFAKGCAALEAANPDDFQIGTIRKMGSRSTLHALEHTHLKLGDQGTNGHRVLEHGGPTDFPAAGENRTITGDGVRIDSRSVVFRSRLGDGVRVGYKSLVQEADLPAGATVPPRTVPIGTVSSPVEW